MKNAGLFFIVIGVFFFFKENGILHLFPFFTAIGSENHNNKESLQEVARIIPV